MTMNHGTSHAAVVIEEQGEKYIVHGYPSGETDFAIDKKKMIANITGPTMTMFKQPLMHYILTLPSHMFQVFRTNKPIILPTDYQLSDQYFFQYCTRAVGPLLALNGIISTDTTYLLSYRPDNIVRELINRDFPSFYMIYDNLLL
jgi:hypothetical protein